MNALRSAVPIFAAMLSSGSAFGLQQLSECAASGELVTLIETVRDRSTRVPLAGAFVTAEWAGNLHPVRLKSDSIGVVRICAPRDRIITLRISYFNAKTTHSILPSALDPLEHASTLDVPAVFIRGSVAEKRSGAPVHNVAVRLVNTPLVTFTNPEGRFIFERVPVGDYTLRIEHISYATVAATVNVRAEDLDATVRLTPAAIPLEPIVVTAFSRKLDRTGFYDRQKRGVGTFIGRKQIDAMNVLRASDILRGIPSARLIPQVPSRRNAPPNRTFGRGQCRYRFIVDGASTLPDFEIDFLTPSEIEGLEVYNGLAEVPALFRAVATPESGSPLCGVIAIWTREGR